MLNLFVGKKSSNKLDVNLMMLEIFKSGKSYSKDDLKMLIFRYRYKFENGVDFIDDDYLSGKYDEKVISGLKVKSRNGWDSFISKNNREMVFKDFKGFESKKVVCENGKFLIK